MLTTGPNVLALLRFGGGHGGGGALLFLGLVFAGVAIWALTRLTHPESSKQ
jgi:hypothetical protein